MNPSSPRWQQVQVSGFTWEAEDLDFVRDGLDDFEPYRVGSNEELLGSRRILRVGDYDLERVQREGPDLRDRAGEHRATKTRRRIRIYAVPSGGLLTRDRPSARRAASSSSFQNVEDPGSCAPSSTPSTNSARASSSTTSTPRCAAITSRRHAARTSPSTCGSTSSGPSPRRSATRTRSGPGARCRAVRREEGGRR